MNRLGTAKIQSLNYETISTPNIFLLPDVESIQQWFMIVFKELWRYTYLKFCRSIKRYRSFSFPKCKKNTKNIAAFDFQHQNILGGDFQEFTHTKNCWRFAKSAVILYQRVPHHANHFPSISLHWLKQHFNRMLRKVMKSIGIRNLAVPISSYIAMRLFKQPASEYKQTFALKQKYIYRNLVLTNLLQAELGWIV